MEDRAGWRDMFTFGELTIVDIMNKFHLPYHICKDHTSAMDIIADIACQN
jgi:hypothetical protein